MGIFVGRLQLPVYRTINVILTNIQRGYPIYGSFETRTGFHAVTIYGINVTSGRIMIMDPQYGSTTCYYGTNGYTYVSEYAGYTFTLSHAICNSW